jgi:hypothetical protein
VKTHSRFVALLLLGFAAVLPSTGNGGAAAGRPEGRSREPAKVGPHPPRQGGTFYLSPTGRNDGGCQSPTAPCRSFAYVFGRMAGGDELVLLDGTYSAGAGTGTMHWDNGANSAQPPSGTPSRPTTIHAQNPGRVTIQGELFIGRSARKDSYITLRGLTFEGGGTLYNTSYVTVKDCGFHGGLGIGTNDHAQGNTDDLIEDVWVWAAGQRIIAINYRAHRNVWRRVVVRGDGCGTPSCSGSGNPNVGFTVYDSHDVSVQNVLVVDRILASSDEGYADFAVAQHTEDPQWYFGRNEWLGTISLNAADQGYYMEPDVGQTVDPTIKISNAVAWNASGGFNLARYGTNNLLENLTVFSREYDAVRVAPALASLGGTLRNVLVLGSGRFAVNSAYPASHVNVSGTWSEGAFNQTSPTNVIPGNPRADGSLRYLTRIEAGSPLKGRGFGGADIGANVLFRYGTDGARYGERGYDALGTVPLWPWPNEDRIKREMCAATTRGFCSTGRRLDGSGPITLTTYVWEALGNPIPAGIYARPRPANP